MRGSSRKLSKQSIEPRRDIPMQILNFSWFVLDIAVHGKLLCEHLIVGRGCDVCNTIFIDSQLDGDGITLIRTPLRDLNSFSMNIDMKYHHQCITTTQG